MKHLLLASLIFYIATIASVVWHGLSKGRSRAALSSALLTIGVVLHTAALVTRTFEAGHLPMANVYETLLLYSYCTALLTLVVFIRYGEKLTALITLPLSVTAIIFAFFNETPARELPLVLKTRWFEAHVSSSFAAYAFFSLAFSGALLYLVSGFLLSKSEERLGAFQDIAARSIIWGFFFFSASMFSGAVWAYLAWGIYWLWEPKVIWSFIVWFWYAGAMHAWHVSSWRGRGLAVATVLGFFVVLFTYLGVGLLMKSSHSF